MNEDGGTAFKCSVVKSAHREPVRLLSVSGDVHINMIFFPSHIMVPIQIIVKYVKFPMMSQTYTTMTKILVLHFDEHGFTEAIPDFLPAAAAC